MGVPQKGIDVRQTGTAIVFRAFLQKSDGTLYSGGTTTLSIIELQSDGTIKSYDFNDNVFKTTALTTPTLALTHRPSNNAATTTGLWTVALNTVTGFTVGGIYMAIVNNSGASPTDQMREFQYGGAEGDLAVTAGATGVAYLQDDLTLIKTQTVTCAAGVTVGAFVGNATAALGVDASGRVDLGKWIGVAPNALNAGRVDSATSIRSSTAQATGNTSTTIKLDSGASATNNLYSDCLILLTGGTGTGQVASILSYVGSTKVATVYPGWQVTPDNTTTFTILPMSQVDLGCTLGSLSLGGTGYVGIDLNAVAHQSAVLNLSNTTIATTQQVDVNTIKTQAVTCGAGVTIRADLGAAAAPGLANGMLIGGSNAATTFAGLTTGALSCTTITASGAVTFQSTFAVTTSTSLAALSATTVTFSGAVAFQSTFVVTTSTNLAALSCSTFAASGTVTFNAFTITNAMLVSGTTTHTGAVSFGSTFGVTSDVSFGARFSIGENLQIVGDLLVGRDLDVSRDMNVGRNWVTTGTTTLAGAVAYSAGLTSNITGTLSTVTNVTNTVALSAAGLDAVVVETGLNARQALSIISAANSGVLSGAGGTTITIKGAGVATTRVIATVDSSGNRSALTLTPPA